MKTFIIERSDEEFYSSTSGISLVGVALNRYTRLASSLAKEERWSGFLGQETGIYKWEAAVV